MRNDSTKYLLKSSILGRNFKKLC